MTIIIEDAYYQFTGMNYLKYLFLTLLMVIPFTHLFAQRKSIRIPKFDDDYSRFVAQLENGATDIDYVAFRKSFLQSEQYKIKRKPFDSLQQELLIAQQFENPEKIIALCIELLSVDYTSISTHKLLRESHGALGDIVVEKKHKDIEFGLFNSIVKNGNGKSCETAWPVIQKEEEIFILQAMKAKVENQKEGDGEFGGCDRYEVSTLEGDELSIFFRMEQKQEQENK